jgi:hypothetical protein
VDISFEAFKPAVSRSAKERPLAERMATMKPIVRACLGRQSCKCGILARFVRVRKRGAELQ